ncbi:MAG: hypothetical protein OH363_05790 [Candidatus Parvarchaeota archaeon]|nr:hypothetical protein [Candidatus Jingweiarchaeum tengchongense]
MEILKKDELVEVLEKEDEKSFPSPCLFLEMIGIVGTFYKKA